METKSKIAVGVKNLKLTMPEGTDPYTNIRASLLSRNGNIWFATTGEGVYRFDRQIFTTLQQKTVWQITLCTGYMKARMAIFGLKQINEFLFTMEKHSSISAPGHGRQQLSGKQKWIDLKNSLNTLNVLKSVLTIIDDKNGNIWFGTENMGLYRYNQ